MLTVQAAGKWLQCINNGSQQGVCYTGEERNHQHCNSCGRQAPIAAVLLCVHSIRWREKGGRLMSDYPSSYTE